MTTVDHVSANIELTRRYFAALEQGALDDELAQFFHPDVVQHEFPNRLVVNGAKRGLAEMLEGARRGQQVVQAQRFEILNIFGAGEQVAVEALWSATLNVPLGTLAAGDTMRAHFGVFLVFQDGRIIKQHNYDCFEPF